MKCQILFSGKNKKNIINLSSAENAQRVVKVKGKRFSLALCVHSFHREKPVWNQLHVPVSIVKGPT